MGYIAFAIWGAVAMFWIRERNGAARRAQGLVAFLFFTALFIGVISASSVESTAPAHHEPCTSSTAPSARTSTPGEG